MSQSKCEMARLRDAVDGLIDAIDGFGNMI